MGSLNRSSSWCPTVLGAGVVADDTTTVTPSSRRLRLRRGLSSPSDRPTSCAGAVASSVLSWSRSTIAAEPTPCHATSVWGLRVQDRPPPTGSYSPGPSLPASSGVRSPASCRVPGVDTGPDGQDSADVDTLGVNGGVGRPRAWTGSIRSSADPDGRDVPPTDAATVSRRTLTGQPRPRGERHRQEVQEESSLRQCSGNAERDLRLGLVGPLPGPLGSAVRGSAVCSVGMPQSVAFDAGCL